jgi:hypothetical protein
MNSSVGRDVRIREPILRSGKKSVLELRCGTVGIICPKCHRRGFVRVERVITKQTAMTHHFCGHCEHEWDADDAPPPQIHRSAVPRKEKP